MSLFELDQRVQHLFGRYSPVYRDELSLSEHMRKQTAYPCIFVNIKDKTGHAYIIYPKGKIRPTTRNVVELTRKLSEPIMVSKFRPTIEKMQYDAKLWSEVDNDLRQKYIKDDKVVANIQPQDISRIKESIRDFKFKMPNKHLFPDRKKDSQKSKEVKSAMKDRCSLLRKIKDYEIIDDMHPLYANLFLKWSMQYAYISGYKQMGFKIINACTCSKKIPLEFYNLIRDKYPRYFPEME